MEINFREIGIVQDVYSFMSRATNYQKNASEYIYSNFGIPLLKSQLNWENEDPDTNLAAYIAAKADGKMALDHYVRDCNGDYATIQSRFRSKEALKYNDVTIRYDMPCTSNYLGETTKCEFYHIDADLFLYGVCDTNFAKREDITGLKKWIILDLGIFRKLCEKGKIVPNETASSNILKDGVLTCNIKSNVDERATRLMVVDICKLYSLSKDIIIAQEGYLNNFTNRKVTFKDLNIQQPVTKTDAIYTKLIPPLVNTFGWKDMCASSDLETFLVWKTAKKLTGGHFLKDANNNLASLHTRFRNPSAAYYNDFTIRYDRLVDGKVQECEFYSMYEDLYLYGVCNKDITNISEVSKLEKYALINMSVIRKLLKDGKIIPNETIKTSQIIDGVLNCKIKNNVRENDSRFLTVDIPLLNTLSKDAIVLQKGYI